MQAKQTSVNRKRRMAGAVLIVLGAFLLIVSAAAKFARAPQVVTELDRMGFADDKLRLIAIVEVTSALLFLLPSTRSIGLLLVSSYLGGAIATHMQHDQSFLQPAVLLCLAWLGIWLRHPETLRSRSSHAGSANHSSRDEQRQNVLQKA